MPYTNVPDDKVEVFDRCVQQVMAQGHDKQAAIAICYTSVVGEKGLFNARELRERGAAEAKRLGKPAHEILAEAAKEASFTVFKQSDGTWRWRLVSSNAYRDHDGEIVSQKALEQDVSRMDATHEYGPLRWWHVPGLDMGACDFVAMHGRMRVESGTFATKEIGANVARAAPGLQVSLGFTHSKSEPDAQGIYHNIHVFERSLLPKGRAANPYTFVSVHKEIDMTSVKEKVAEFVEKVFGGDEAKAKEFINGLDQTQKEIEQAGVKFKAKGETKAEGDMPVEGETEDEEAEDGAEAKAEDMPMAEAVISAVTDAVTEVMAGGGDTEDEEVTEEEAGKAKTKARKVTTEVGGQSGKRSGRKKAKETSSDMTLADLSVDEFAAVLGAALHAQAATKEKDDEQTTLKQALDTIADLQKRVAELEGSTSKAFRASKEGKAPSSAKTPGASEQEKKLKEGGADNFVSWAVDGNGKQ